jgi:hypothetical protein
VHDDSLKATELNLMQAKGGNVVHSETPLKGLGRIQDIEVWPGHDMFFPSRL